MLKKIISHLWALRVQFVRYFIIGCSSVLLDIGSLYLLKHYFGVRQTVAVIINQPFIVLYVFLLNRWWSFGSSDMAHRQLLRFCAVAGANYFFSTAWMWLVSERLGVQYLLARIANIILAISWNFLLYKHWVYAHQPGMVSSHDTTSGIA